MSGRTNGDRVEVAAGASANADAPEFTAEAEHVRDVVVGDENAVSGADLPQVLRTAPAAVALIDLDAGVVTYANDSALDLTGGKASLPVDVDAWSEAAGLTDLSGARRATPRRRCHGSPRASRSPASRWRWLRRPAGTAATEEEREEVEGRLLWVTGFPLSESAVETDARRLALVVFLQLSGSGAQRHLEMVRDRAVLATELAFTISDPSRPQNPLVWVNPSFTRLTGYELDEVIGRNCRFLQGPNTDPASISRIRTALAEERGLTEVLLTTAGTAPRSGTRSRSRRSSTAAGAWSTSSACSPTSRSASWSRTSAAPRSRPRRRPASSCGCSPSRPPR